MSEAEMDNYTILLGLREEAACDGKTTRAARF